MDLICPACGVEVPAPASEGCPACAHRFGRSESQTLRLETRLPLPSQRTPVRLFGAPPAGLGLALALITLALAAALLLAGRPVFGIALAVVGLALAAVFAAEARQLFLRSGLPRLVTVQTAKLRDGLARSGRAAIVAGAELRARAAHVRVSFSAWSTAVIWIARCRRAQRRFQHTRSKLIQALGEATYLGKPDLAAVLNAEAHTIAALITETKRLRGLTTSQARERIARHQGATPRTHTQPGMR